MGEIQALPELEQIEVASQYGYRSDEWDDLPLDERVRLLAAARDQRDLAYIRGLLGDDRRNLVARTEWVVLDRDPNARTAKGKDQRNS